MPQRIETEQQTQAKLIKELESAGYYVIKLVRTNKNGIPDIVAIPNGSDVKFFEVKRHDGKASKLQQFRIDELKRRGISATIYRGPKPTENE